MESWSWPPDYDDRYVPPDGQPYWFPERETMETEAREAAILERIREVMRYALANSPFYRQKWSHVGLEPNDINTLEDFERVPVVTKEELRQAQVDHPPLGDYLCVPEADVAGEHSIDPREFGIRILFFSGEPGASIPSIRRQIENAYGGDVFDSGSMAELTPWTHLAETTAHSGMLCWQDMVYTEVADPDTHRRVAYGCQGTPIYTHLERTSQPMIRLRSGDLTLWESGPSPCGRTYPILPRGIYGRIDDQFTVRGENIYPSAIDEIVSSLAAYGGEHRIVVSRSDAMDSLAVQIEYGRELAGDQAQIEAFRDQAAEALRTVLGVRTHVVPVPPNTLDRTEFKARRVIDERDLFRELTEST